MSQGKPILYTAFLFFILLRFSGHSAGQVVPASQPIPHLERRGQATQLIVDGKALLILGGELHNSSASSIEYMKPIWPRLAAMHLNTVILPIAWESVEPEEGKYDFALIDGLLEGARQNNLKIVLLWFGTWKNTYSSYVPGWVKRDAKRFPRVQLSSGAGTERISPFSQAAKEADAKIFRQLMHHLRDVDEHDHTIVMVQVENEVGVIPEGRDHSDNANAAFMAPVPSALTSFLQKRRRSLDPELWEAWEEAGGRTSGTWQEIFGKGSLTDDFFMAWQYATYIEYVTAAGKTEYPLPMFANAALIRPNYEPGQYNSGGPLPHSRDIWRAGAPSLDFLSPDIYFNEFAFWSKKYTYANNPLFIPETQGGATGAANALFAFGQLNAIGFSPFGIDDFGNTPFDLVGITAERSDPSALPNAYARLRDLTPLLLAKQQTGALSAALIEGEAQRGARVDVGNYTATVTRAGGAPGARVGVMFVSTGPDEFLVVGSGDAQVVFSSQKPGEPIIGIESIDEEFFQNGSWVRSRRLNGDENSQGQSLRLKANDAAEGRIYRVRLYRYH